MFHTFSCNDATLSATGSRLSRLLGEANSSKMTLEEQALCLCMEPHELSNPMSEQVDGKFGSWSPGMLLGEWEK